MNVKKYFLCRLGTSTFVMETFRTVDQAVLRRLHYPFQFYQSVLISYARAYVYYQIVRRGFVARSSHVMLHIRVHRNLIGRNTLLELG